MLNNGHGKNNKQSTQSNIIQKIKLQDKINTQRQISARYHTNAATDEMDNTNAVFRLCCQQKEFQYYHGQAKVTNLLAQLEK